MKRSTSYNHDTCLDPRGAVQDFLDLTIENDYSKEDIMYFLNEACSSEIFRKTSRKYVYLVHKKSLNSVVVKIWYERGILRFFKNFVKGGSRAVREAKNMMLLKKYGLGTPPIVSYGNYAEKNVKGYISFIITEQLVGVQPYAEIVKKFYSGECEQGEFNLMTTKIINEIAKMHLNALTHNDIHIHNILVKDVTAEGSNAFFLDTLAVKKRNNRTFFSLLDIGKFYFWMQNDKKDSYLLPKEREYILKEYYKQTSDIYPFNYRVFRFLIKAIAIFIKKTYNLNRSIRNIQ